MPLPRPAMHFENHFGFLFGLMLCVYSGNYGVLRAQQEQRSQSFLEAGGFFVDAFAAGQGGQSSAFTISNEVSGLISGRPFEGVFSPSQWNTSMPFYLQYSKRINAHEQGSSRLGLRLGISRLTEYGPQTINPVTLSVLQLRYSKPLVRIGPFDLGAVLGFGLAGVEQNSSTIASGGLESTLVLSKNFQLKLGTEFTSGLNQNFFDFLTYTSGLSYRLRPSRPKFTAPMAYADRDLDGVSDENDRCPDDFGLGANLGCPDQDNDQIVDIDDLCPLVAGVPENKGCPIDDADGDRVADALDQCPMIKGSIANFGCPEPILAALVIDLNQQAMQLPFSRGDGDFSSPVDQQLEAVVRSMKKNVLEHYLILGFTDAIGPTALNQRLSEERAKAFYDYLVSRGIDAARLRFEGRGELPEDKSLDGVEPHPHRRVEIHLISKK